MRVHFREQYGTRGDEILYVTPSGFWLFDFFERYLNKLHLDQKNIVRVPLQNDKLIIREKFLLVKILQEIFLPKGYPDSVSDDYIAYQFWDTIQAFCSTINGTLTTHAILKGIGVGNDFVTPLSATFTWVLKEGTGHLGKILFAWWKGSQLDTDSKKWRLKADILNDIAMGIEVFVLPKFMEHSTYILCGTTTIKAIVGVAGSSTRAALTQHHALRGNLADVSSKDNAQETCVNLIASFIGLYLLTAIRSQTVLYSLFIIVSFIHIYTNTKAVKSICLKTFNESRYLITLEEYFRSGRMLTPQQANKLERVTLGQTVSVSSKICLGLSAKNLIQNFKTGHEIDNFFSTLDPNEKFIILENRKYISIYLHFDTKSQDILKAYFFAVSYLQDRNQLRERYREVQNKWNEFLNMAHNEGWCTTSHLLMVDEYRLDWKI